MKSVLLGLLAETPIHPGTGRSIGVVDLPVAREAATDYPVIVGSSLKGALRDHASRVEGFDASARFGRQDHAGDLLVADARLLLLPVRSLTGAYRWVTGPHILERYSRDRARAGLPELGSIPRPDRGRALTSGEGSVFLEERQFEVGGTAPDDLLAAISEAIPHPSVRERVTEQVAILHDDDLAWFARYGLSIQARNVLDAQSKQSTSLWYEESLPPDTLMYSVLVGRTEAALEAAVGLFPEGSAYLQAGGNETVGHGWFAVAVAGAAITSGAPA